MEAAIKVPRDRENQTACHTLDGALRETVRPVRVGVDAQHEHAVGVDSCVNWAASEQIDDVNWAAIEQIDDAERARLHAERGIGRGET